MRWKGKKYTLSPAGWVFIIVVALMIAMFVYLSSQPKQVEYIYKQLFGKHEVKEPILPQK